MRYAHGLSLSPEPLCDEYVHRFYSVLYVQFSNNKYCLFTVQNIRL